MSLKDATNEEIRRALFDSVVERLEIARRDDPALAAYNVSPNATRCS
jgi:hypothetical protein